MKEIRAAFPEAHAVAIVRDPVDLVAAYFAFLKQECWEDRATIEDAWAVQDQRRRGQCIPSSARRPSSLVYADVALLGRQVWAARDVFEENLRVFTLSDLRQSSARVSEEVQSLVGLQPIDLGPLPRLNPARRPRLGWLNQQVKAPPKPIAQLRDALKRSFGVSSLGLRRRVEPLNSRRIRNELRPGFVQELREYFREDVDLLEHELSRNLRAEWGW
jgi:hypothetical protein